ncbi:HD domain-containing protein [Nocardiopsis sp. NRRL B-16309]|uniref:HD domain-containing protein n=1 Tax=Nocardiopsis sp. NRRL B-16309 TaxID=1519494 RepID=UPI0006AE3D08|nr:HD domain-containing protein [Nocardiopsis sp. NRRL B-16309]KOX13941.1 phosphohydrolase [Nocardiopsis sp. NRRL B-16309]
MTAPLEPLPEAGARLLAECGAPPRLVAHGRLVHDVAARLLDWLGRNHPALEVDTEAVRFGAAVHDIGKTVHPEELSAPGHRHERAGERLLLDRGTSPGLARFCATHGDWAHPDRTSEDLLVSLADKVWKGARKEDLELRVVRWIADAEARPAWEVFAALDDALRELADGADWRLAHQARHPVTGAAAT